MEVKVANIILHWESMYRKCKDDFSSCSLCFPCYGAILLPPPPPEKKINVSNLPVSPEKCSPFLSFLTLLVE